MGKKGDHCETDNASEAFILSENIQEKERALQLTDGNLDRSDKNCVLNGKENSPNKALSNANVENEEIQEEPIVSGSNKVETTPAAEASVTTTGSAAAVAVDDKRQFKLRVVPLEKLLEKPKGGVVSSKNALSTNRGEETITINLSDSSDSECKSNDSVILLRSSSRNRKKQNQKQKKSVTVTEKNSLLRNGSIDKQENNSKQQFPIVAAASTPSIAEYRIRRCVVRIQRTRMPSTAHAVSANNDQKKSRVMSTSTSTSTSSSSSSSTSPNTTMSKADQAEADNSKRSSSPDAEMEEYKSSASSSDSEIIPARKKRAIKKKEDTSEEASESELEKKKKEPRKKRRRVKRNSSDSDSANSDGDDDNDKKKHKRKDIRKIIKTKDLDISTKTATKEEEERRKRIEERQKLYNQIYEKPNSVEVNELVLDFDEKSKKPLLQVDKGLLKKLKPHQVAGVKFMWDACFETLKDMSEKPGSGCILAHCMGLGKTLQIVTLAHTLLVNSGKTSVERVLIISPLSTLNNWAREFHHWISFATKKHVEVYDMSKFRDKATRIFKLNEWFQEGGVCVLGYDMYRILSNEKAKGLRKKQRETLQKALVDPGPDMVVCDEGHLLKNEKTSLSKAVTRMRTKRRIVLTGTPLQNNLKEYYCMIQFIKPNLLGTYKEYLNRFVNPITNGQYTDSTERDIRLMKHRSHILHKMLEGCIQRRDYSVLAPYLPPKHEYVVYCSLSELQQQLYEHYMSTQRDLSNSDINGKGARLFQDFQDLRRIWTHPMNLRMNSDHVIRKRLMANDTDSMEEFICDDEEEDLMTNSDNSIDSSQSFNSDPGALKVPLKPRKTRSNRNVTTDESEDEVQAIDEKDDPSEWWKRFVEEKELNNINHSPKLVVLMRLLQQCEAIGDKLLVFSQSLQSLDVIEHFLSLIDSKTKGHEIEGDVGDFKGTWTPGKDYFRLDGSCSVENREIMCKQFNNTTNLRARLFLISTRAGGLGINLVAANRVVIFDVSWNPSHDTQSIFRVYRFGQEKPCYIYRLIAMGTMEQKVYERQVTKQATAKRVIDEQQISRHYNQSDLQELYTYELKPSVEREIPILPKDRLFAEMLRDYESLLFKYHEHDSLLENEESENLSEAERKAAWDEYEAEKTRSVQTAQYMSYDRGAYGGQYGNASGSVTSNKIFGFRSDVLLQLLNMKVAKDMPDLTQNQIIQMVPSYLQRLYTEMNNGDPTMYKDLLQLHSTIAHPSGMYMSPLLYANQNPAAAGYYQAPPGQTQPPQAAQPDGMLSAVPGQMPIQHANSTKQGFEPDKVYEID